MNDTNDFSGGMAKIHMPPMRGTAIKLDLDLCKRIAGELTGGEVSEQMAMLMALRGLAIATLKAAQIQIDLVLQCHRDVGTLAPTAQAIEKALDLIDQPS